MLLYPSVNELDIVISEVKSPKGDGLNNNLVTGAFKQLLRDVKFLLALLPDILAENIKIKALASFPETNINHLFCKDCSEYILSKEDFNLGLEHLEQKMSMKDPVLNDQNKNLFLTAVARLIGAESEECLPKTINTKSKLPNHEASSCPAS